MLIKIYTMEKDEDDILEEWIKYHAEIVGYNNIHIIDNHSGQATQEILTSYINQGINVRTGDDYRMKGDYIYDWIKSCPETHLAIPLDLDEFIVLLESGDPITVNTQSKVIRHYLEQLPSYSRYAFGGCLTSRNTKMFYHNPLHEISQFNYVNSIQTTLNGQQQNLNKKFFRSDQITGLDHGNHNGSVNDNGQDHFYETNLFLLHYHFRGVYKTIEKCRNDIIGLYGSTKVDEILYLDHLIDKGSRGVHNVKTYRQALQQGAYSLLMIEPDPTTIELKNLW